MTTPGPHLGVVLNGGSLRNRVPNSTAMPFRWVGRIATTWADGNTYVGTGTLIDNSYVLTCAHNVVDRQNGIRLVSATFTPGQNTTATGAPYAPYNPVQFSTFRVPQQYSRAGGPRPPIAGIAVTEITNYLYDFAVGKLSAPIYNAPAPTGFTYPPIDPTSFPMANCQIAGYSGDLDPAAQTMYQRAGAASLDATEDFVSYRMNTFNGDSGAAVFYKVPGYNTWKIVGVHVTGVPDTPGFQDGFNFGPAINQDNYDLIQEMISEMGG